MANTGPKWSAWTVLQNAVVLTQGGTIVATSDAVSLDMKAGCEYSVVATYSDDAKATAGLSVSILRDVDGTNYQVAADLPQGVEMVFTQNAARSFVDSICGMLVGSFKLYLAWGNTTAGSVVTVTTRYRTCDVPVAS